MSYHRVITSNTSTLITRRRNIRISPIVTTRNTKIGVCYCSITTTTRAWNNHNYYLMRRINHLCQKHSYTKRYLVTNSKSSNGANEPSSSSSSSNIDEDTLEEDSNESHTNNSKLKLNGNGSGSNTMDGNDDSILIRNLPVWARPYAYLARVDKPIGTALLLWPCLWSTALAASKTVEDGLMLSGLPDPKLVGLFTVGSLVMRGAGCTINDMWDRDYDKEVARTKTRPLANGDLTMNQAFAFLGAQLTAGLGVLLSLPNMEYCVGLGLASIPLVAAYPLMKRFTNWPQLVLGMTFNWGCFMGWAATHGGLDLNVVVPLYASGVSWTMVYDTLYAHQDKVDDAKLGLKSTALHFGGQTKPILHGFAVLTIIGWDLAGYGAGFTHPAFYIGTLAAYTHLVWQIHSSNLEDPSNLAHRFKSNNEVGGIMFLTCVAGSLTSTPI